MGAEDLKGDTTFPLSIRTAGHTFVVPVAKTLLFVVTPTVIGGPVRMGVSELATTIGSALGTPGELTDRRRLDCRYSADLARNRGGRRPPGSAATGRPS